MKYALDTNIFIDGFRNEEAQAEVFVFLNRALPFTYLSAVVMQELAAGARTAEYSNRSNAANVCLHPPARLSSRAVVFSRPSPHGMVGGCSTKSRHSLMTH